MRLVDTDDCQTKDDKVFWFMDVETGEEFYVYGRAEFEAELRAGEYFDGPLRSYGEVDLEMAEVMGYDMY